MKTNHLLYNDFKTFRDFIRSLKVQERRRKMLTIASYIKTEKKYANNISISDEDFVRSHFVNVKYTRGTKIINKIYNKGILKDQGYLVS